MAKLSESLSHPAWQGVGALATIAGLLLGAYSLYLAASQPGAQPQPDSAYSQKAKGAGADSPAGRINEGLSSIDESYTGVHKYFNDWKPVAAISVALIAGGLIASSRGRGAEGRKS